MQATYRHGPLLLTLFAHAVAGQAPWQDARPAAKVVSADPARLAEALGVGEPAASSDAPISVRLKPQKTALLLGEPLYVVATVKNTRSVPVELVGHNAPRSVEMPSEVDILVGRDPENMLGWWDDLRGMIYKVGPRRVAPGEIIEVNLTVLFNREDGFFAKEPGTYWIQGRVVQAVERETPGVNYIEYLSDPVSIEVRKPGPADRATWEWLKAHQGGYGRLVQVPWMGDLPPEFRQPKLPPEFLEECSRVCEQSGSVYVQYLALSLSRFYQESPIKDAEKAARLAEIARDRATTEMVRTFANKLLVSAGAMQESPPPALGADQP